MSYLTISAIKADVGSIGGHTRPSEEMLEACRHHLADGVHNGDLLDFVVTYTGDDICLTMSHRHGDHSALIHIDYALEAFKRATVVAKRQGLYGAGQDILVDAPSSNLRGCGPGIAEVSFEFGVPERPVESFLVVTADKCGPGAFNPLMVRAFADPNYCAGLMLPKMIAGFDFEVVDMDQREADSVALFRCPEDLYRMLFTLRAVNSFAVGKIWSRTYPRQQVASASTDRLHNISGKYSGKDDPVAILRTQGIFPAPEEITSVFLWPWYTAGDARGSHNMPLTPMPVNTTVNSAYCQPLVTCLAYSVTAEGELMYTDMFDGAFWDSVRNRANQMALEMRSQGVYEPAMLPFDELEYSDFKITMAQIRERFGPTTNR